MSEESGQQVVDHLRWGNPDKYRTWRKRKLSGSEWKLGSDPHDSVVDTLPERLTGLQCLHAATL